MAEENISQYTGALLTVSNEADIAGDQKSNLLIDNMIFNKELYKRFDLSGNPNFVLCLGANTVEDFDVMNTEKIFIDTKDENDNEITVINFDLLLQNMFDWHENIVVGNDYKYVGYKYIVHGIIGNIDVYLLFVKGTLYMEFIEYIHNYVLKNLDTVKEICKVADQISVKTEVEKTPEEEPQVEVQEESTDGE